MDAPLILYGNSEQTRANWGAVARTAWNRRSWNSANANDQLLSLDCTQGPIVVWNNILRKHVDRRFIAWETGAEVWQFNWIVEVFPTDYETVVSEPERHLELILEGLELDWFSIGMLEGDPRFFPFFVHYNVYRPTPSVVQSVVRPILKGFLQWLPKLVACEPRLAICDGRGRLAHCSLASRLGMFVDLAFHAGYLDEHVRSALSLDEPEALLQALYQVYQRVR